MTDSPICKWFGLCGGCLFQDVPFEDYIKQKEHFVRQAFAGQQISVNLEPVRTVPLHSRRRASFAFAKGHLGYNAHKSHSIIDIDSCELLTPALCGILEPLRELTKKLKGSGDIFVLDTPFGIDMHIKCGKARANLEVLETLTEFAQKNCVARLIYNNDPILEQVKLQFGPDAFLQPSQAGQDILVKLMMQETQGAKNAVDLFCGSGTFTTPLHNAGIKVIGYDCAGDSIKAIKSYAIERDLFRNPLLPAELKNIDFVVIDPPRAGARAQIEQLAKTGIQKIVMISCNPLTGARDAKILIDNGWQLNKVTPIDQFTYSKHIEIVCVFEKQL